MSELEIDSTCEQCGQGFDHHYTDALARFDFCSAKCEDEYWHSSTGIQGFVTCALPGMYDVGDVVEIRDGIVCRVVSKSGAELNLRRVSRLERLKIWLKGIKAKFQLWSLDCIEQVREFLEAGQKGKG